ncbi:hypothetical protein EGR_07183 [Echinococcus granulosus]|uniref:Uncharacterized protein n=1 Tax=Echinococcus granulosus TaxID=6210 RepID=W6UBR3_ECHGR|nr:hypothetical protein EGR_07183 [Echinococcus granulosus]EUB57991.1 hypothetical protein EGR_07183 [Echinococcus granulosus]
MLLMIALPTSELLFVVGGFLRVVVVAFGIGANDAANSLGTSVGSRDTLLRCLYFGHYLCARRIRSSRRTCLQYSQQREVSLRYIGGNGKRARS